MADFRDYPKSECRTYSELHHSFMEVGRPLKLDFQGWLDERDRCRKDLFYLGTEILGKNWYEKPHREYCSFFVQKNFDGTYHEGYNLDDVHNAIGKQEREKEMLLLAPRGSYKSTVDGVDVVQWLLNCPDIRILVLTGELSLAQAFLYEIKQYFTKRESHKHTRFQRLFPEYILTERAGNNDQPLLCPARNLIQKEPSVWVNSIPANLSGWHCDILKGDDVVTDENSASVTQREKINKKFRNARNLVDQWGFKDNIGTPYEDGDWYHERLKVKDTAPMLYGNYSAWTVKPGFEFVPLKQLHEQDVTLLFPEKLSFVALRLSLMEDEQLFRRQQLCEVGSNPDTVTFTEEALKSHLLMPDTLQSLNPIVVPGDVYILWDWATSTARTADFSCGSVCRIMPPDAKYKGVVLEHMNFGRWKPSDLAFQIVQTAMQYRPKMVLIEKMQGSELLQLEVGRVSNQCDFPLNIWWKEPEKMGDAKARRIKGLQTLLNDDRLWFVSAPWNDELFYQLQRFTGERSNRGRKDDLPDSLSMIQYFLPLELKGGVQRVKTPDEEAAELLAEHNKLMRGYYDRMFSSASKPTLATVSPEPSAVPAGLPDVFGGNGMRL